ncbi:MAG: hypothetical protein ABFD25_05960 [Clostridiaceae bacterium]
MLCSSIEEYSILYMENDLDTKAREHLARHIEKCDKCRFIFNLIKANYHAEENVTNADNMVSGNMLDHIDKNRYLITRSRFKPFTWKRVILVSLICTLFIFATVNAKKLVKTYGELVNSLFTDSRRYFITAPAILNGDLSDEEYVKSVYKKYKTEIDAFADKMKTAEISRLSFNENGKNFKVQIAKGVKGNFITYGFEGYGTFQNEFLQNNYMKEEVNSIKFATVDELLDAAGLCPVPGYIPKGYGLKYANQVNGNKGSTVPEYIGLAYEKDKGKYLNIILTRNKTIADIAGLSEEPENAAGLSESGSLLRPAAVIRETLEISGYQAVCSELGKAITISIYLGDSAKLPILKVESACLDKETLIMIVENIKIANSSENEKKADDYFQGIEDERILAFANNFLDEIKAGKTKFSFDVSQNIKLYKDSENEAYGILYSNINDDQLKSLIPINLEEDLIERFEAASLQITGWPYTAQKVYSIGLINKGVKAVNINIDREIKLADNLDMMDQIVLRMHGMKNDIKPVFNRSGQLYYVTDLGGRLWSVFTVYPTTDGVGHQCNFFINKSSVIPDENALMDFINNLH